jgi:hypothetical protein
MSSSSPSRDEFFVVSAQQLDWIEQLSRLSRCWIRFSPSREEIEVSVQRFSAVVQKIRAKPLLTASSPANLTTMPASPMRPIGKPLPSVSTSSSGTQTDTTPPQSATSSYSKESPPSSSLEDLIEPGNFMVHDLLLPPPAATTLVVGHTTVLRPSELEIEKEMIRRCTLRAEKAVPPWSCSACFEKEATEEKLRQEKGFRHLRPDHFANTEKRFGISVSKRRLVLRPASRWVRSNTYPAEDDALGWYCSQACLSLHREICERTIRLRETRRPPPPIFSPDCADALR